MKHFMNMKAWGTMLLLGLCLGLTACGDDDEPIVEENKTETGGGNTDTGGDDNNDEGTDEGDNTTPGNPVWSTKDAQDELDRVGKAVMKKINAQDLKQLVVLAEYCAETFMEDDEEEYYPGYWDQYPYYSPTQGLKKLMRSVSQISQGDFMQTVSTRTTGEIYELSQFFGTFTWDEEEEDWVETKNSKQLLYKFSHNGKACSVSVTPSSDVYSWFVKDENGLAGDEVRIPKKVTAEVIEGGRTLATFTLNTTQCSQSAKKYAVDATFKAMSSYQITTSLSDNNSEAKATGSLKIGTEEIMKMEAVVKGNNLANDNQFADGSFNGHKSVQSATLNLNVLNSVNVRLKADNTTGASEQLEDFDGYYYYYEYPNYYGEPYIHKYSDAATAEAEAREAADVVNANTTSDLYFNKGSYSAPITWKATEVYHNSWPWYDSYTGRTYQQYDGEWGVEPVISFDGVPFLFESYFNESRFSSLIDTFNDLIRDFENLL